MYLPDAAMVSNEVERVPQDGQIPGLSEEEREKAAQLIQRTYRGHRTRRELDGFGLDASTRWYEAVEDAQYQHRTKPRPPEQFESRPDTPPVGDRPTSPLSPARQNWQRVTTVARRANTEDRFSKQSDEPADDAEQNDDREKKLARKVLGKKAKTEDEKTAKTMDLAYWLELVDQKHRHGSNLRKYHAYWQKQDTKQPFFTWLDEGDGRDVEVEECSRERLEKMQVRYLSREERLNYWVKIDEQGLLRWAKNDEKVWTKDELYKDSIKGIVPTNDPTPAFKYNVPPEKESSDEISSEQDESDDETTKPDEGEQYINEEFHRAKGPAKLKHVSASVLFNHMIRSSLRKGHKWIFVCDTSFRLYIGYKQIGAFQHSSFMHGSRIMAAGQIKVKDGQLRRLSPLSGHYRPPVANFRAFVHHLEQAGTDMSHVSISQSYAVLVGLEGYTKTRKKIKEAEDSVSHGKDKVLHPDKVKKEEEAAKDKSQSAEKERQYLEQERIARQRTDEQEKADKSVKGRVARLVKRFSLSDDSKDNEKDRKVSSGNKQLPGPGAEEGIPPPEGDLLRR